MQPELFVTHEPTIGQRVKAVREYRGMQQQKLAEIVGCTPTHLSDVERDQRGVSLELLQSLSVTLDVPMDYLMIDETHIAKSYLRDDILGELTEQMTPETLKKLITVAESLLGMQQDYEKRINLLELALDKK